jgi:hypothetical protein
MPIAVIRLWVLPFFLTAFAAFPYGFCRISLWVLPYFLMGFAAFPYWFARHSSAVVR